MISDKRSDEKLVDVLKNKDPNLANQLDKIKEKGLETWMGFLGFDMGSHNGYPHLLNVERNADKIIPDKIKKEMGAGEIFLLLSAIFLHDIGKAIPTIESPHFLNIKNYRCPTCDKYVIDPNQTKYDKNLHAPCGKPLWNHYRNSQKIIEEVGVSLGLPDEKLAEYCGLLALCHGLDQPPTQEQNRFNLNAPIDKDCIGKEEIQVNFRDASLAYYGKLRIPFLSAVLRIADETDHKWNRAVNKWYIQLTSNPGNLGKAFRRYIEDVEFSHLGECVILHISKYPEKNLSNEVMEGINQARQEIYDILIKQEKNNSKWGKILINQGINFNGVYIEFGGVLFKEFNSNTINKPLALGEIIDEKSRSSLKLLLDSAIELVQGSYGFGDFTWDSFEAQVGRPLTDPEKWLTLKIKCREDNEDLFYIYEDPGLDTIHIFIKENARIDSIRENILGAKNVN